VGGDAGASEATRGELSASMRGGAIVVESGVRARADVVAVSVSGVAWTGMARP
jgi:hypothetical protein